LCWRSGIPFTEISAGDLDVAVFGQLPATKLPLGDEFEPCSLQMVGFEAPFRCRGPIEQSLEYASRNPDDPFILADPDAELDGGPFGVPVRIRGKTEEHCDLLRARISCSGIVLKMPETERTSMAAVQGERIPGGFILITGIDGVRYAVRQHAVAVIIDADECRDETLVQLHGGHVVRVPCSLEEVLAWFA
jgi:hypothetical protein